jgi:hypothetical protein
VETLSAIGDWLSKNTTITNALISGLIALIVGTIASLFAPWVQWGIEKRRSKLRYRCERISSWRNFIRNRFEAPGIFRETDTYISMRPYLSKALVRDIEEAPIEESSRIRVQILEELSRLERRWGLI